MLLSKPCRTSLEALDAPYEVSASVTPLCAPSDCPAVVVCSVERLAAVVDGGCRIALCHLRDQARVDLGQDARWADAGLLDYLPWLRHYCCCTTAQGHHHQTMCSPAPDMPPAALFSRGPSFMTWHVPRLHARPALGTMNSSRAVWAAPHWLLLPLQGTIVEDWSAGQESQLLSPMPAGSCDAARAVLTGSATGHLAWLRLVRLHQMTRRTTRPSQSDMPSDSWQAAASHVRDSQNSRHTQGVTPSREF